jgi:hypothetical protein
MYGNLVTNWSHHRVEQYQGGKKYFACPYKQEGNLFQKVLENLVPVWWHYVHEGPKSNMIMLLWYVMILRVSSSYSPLLYHVQIFLTNLRIPTRCWGNTYVKIVQWGICSLSHQGTQIFGNLFQVSSRLFHVLYISVLFTFTDPLTWKQWAV